MNKKTPLPYLKKMDEYERSIALIKEEGSWDAQGLKELEAKLNLLREKAYSKLTPWQRVQISRHPNRPRSIDYIKNLFTDFIELSGDRTFGEDCSMIAGFGMLDGNKVAVVAQEKGNDLESRMRRNFGMSHPEGFRKARRVMQLAEKFNLPVVTFIDTPGAYPGLTAEERGQGRVIAENLYAMAELKVPIICVIIGEGCSGGALAIGVGNVIGMLENAYYSVISPEGCASILYKDVEKKDIAAKKLKILAEDLIQMGIIDAIIKEPVGGAHIQPQFVFEQTKSFLLDQLKTLSRQSQEELVEGRYQKYRKIGAFSNKD
jgi:acetyl-CoA carboxylase carboxyl transferase subunit alpha